MDLIISSVTHRSGSTLLQRIFNARQETLIWGEQNGCLSKFLEIYNNFTFMNEVGGEYHKQKYFSSKENPNIWIANINPDRNLIKAGVINAVQALFKTMYSEYSESHDCVGFKEVKYGKAELNLIRDCYPKAKIILLVRNPIKIWSSAIGCDWYSDQEGEIDEFIEKWNNNASYFLELASNDSNVFLFRYEDIVEKDGPTIDLLCSLAQISKQRIKYVLNRKLYSSQKNISEADEQKIITHCGKVMREYRYIFS
jgi:hypothetical protein